MLNIFKALACFEACFEACFILKSTSSRLASCLKTYSQGLEACLEVCLETCLEACLEACIMLYWGGPSWWAWFWQLARLLKTELLLLVIMRHLHLRPSRSSTEEVHALVSYIHRLLRSHFHLLYLISLPRFCKTEIPPCRTLLRLLQWRVLLLTP